MKSAWHGFIANFETRLDSEAFVWVKKIAKQNKTEQKKKKNIAYGQQDGSAG